MEDVSCSRPNQKHTEGNAYIGCTSKFEFNHGPSINQYIGVVTSWHFKTYIKSLLNKTQDNDHSSTAEQL